MIILLIRSSYREKILFKYDTNPYRRICKKCNAQQEVKCWNWDWNADWWEETSEGNNSNCRCKKYQRYQSLYSIL